MGKAIVTANLEAAVSALEEVDPIANPRATGRLLHVENELMLTPDNIAGFPGRCDQRPG